MSIETSAFTSTGFDVFPNVHSDEQEVLKVVEWGDEKLLHKLDEYGSFLQRPDIMPRARKVADFILDRLIFDQACRDGVYDEFINEDELCGGSDE
jgi:hypothetical protein